jgi:hypothetical protein
MKEWSNLHYVHRQLSAIHHAATMTFEDIYFAFVKLEWNNATYLTVAVECYQKDAQKIADRMMHGLLSDGYDYRFMSVGKPLGHEPSDLVTVNGTIDLNSKGFNDNMITLNKELTPCE